VEVRKGATVKEDKRNERNAVKLAELHASFAKRVRAILETLEGEGLRPRIQQAWRSPEDQRQAYESGHSKLKFGFHNLTGPKGGPDSLAVDVLDDDHPTQSGIPYLLHLAAAAEADRCVTGIRWGLPAKLREAVDRAIAEADWDAPVKIGWDPTHVQPGDLTLREAKKGKRPK
jgi:hypothetical protein